MPRRDKLYGIETIQYLLEPVALVGDLGQPVLEHYARIGKLGHVVLGVHQLPFRSG